MQITTAYLITNPDSDTKSKVQILGGQWSLQAKGWFLTQEQKDRLDSGDVPVPTLPNGIFIDDDVTDWRVHGQTYDVRDKIKQLGGRWVGSTKSWAIPVHKASKEDIIAALT